MKQAARVSNLDDIGVQQQLGDVADDGNFEVSRDLRPEVGHDDVMSLLSRHFGKPVARLEPIAGGQVVRTFSFEVGYDEYIIRFNFRTSANFEQEVFSARFVTPVGILTLPLLCHNQFGELHYAISRKALGIPLIQLERTEVETLTSTLVAMLDTKHAVDVSDTKGYSIVGRGWAAGGGVRTLGGRWRVASERSIASDADHVHAGINPRAHPTNPPNAF